MKNAPYVFLAVLCAYVKTLYPQTASSDLFSGEQGMTGYTGHLSGGSWSVVFPQAIAVNEEKNSHSQLFTIRTNIYSLLMTESWAGFYSLSLLCLKLCLLAGCLCRPGE